MESAADALRRDLRGAWPDARRIVVVCGPGKNGGDGLAVARLLALEGAFPSVFTLKDPALYTGESAANAQRARGVGLSLTSLGRTGGPAALRRALADGDVVIDALFGTGLSRPLEGGARRAVALLNASGRRVLAADLPSGLSADRGVLLGAAVRASRTVTFAAPKLCHVLPPASGFCGEVTVAEIGIARPILAAAGAASVDDGGGRRRVAPSRAAAGLAQGRLRPSGDSRRLARETGRRDPGRARRAAWRRGPRDGLLRRGHRDGSRVGPARGDGRGSAGGIRRPRPFGRERPRPRLVGVRRGGRGPGARHLRGHGRGPRGGSERGAGSAGRRRRRAQRLRGPAPVLRETPRAHRPDAAPRRGRPAARPLLARRPGRPSRRGEGARAGEPVGRRAQGRAHADRLARRRGRRATRPERRCSRRPAPGTCSPA